jgi:hypothetical protein
LRRTGLPRRGRALRLRGLRSLRDPSRSRRLQALGLLRARLRCHHERESRHGETGSLERGVEAPGHAENHHAYLDLFGVSSIHHGG